MELSSSVIRSTAAAYRASLRGEIKRMTETRYERLASNRESVGGHNSEEIELETEVRLQATMKKPIQSRFVHFAIGTLGIIMLYLSLSICLTFYQQRLLKELKFPFSIVLYHLVIKFILSAIARGVYRIATGKPRVLLDWRTSLKKMAPTGVASGIDIGFSNWGLELVKISLYTMTKSTTIIFILLFAIILGLEKKSWSLVFIVVMISGGLFMFNYKSTQFDVFGFIFLLFASFTSGIRWSFAQLIMQKSKLGLHNPVDMIYHMQPWMILSILPFTIALEGRRLVEAFAQIPETPYEDMFLILIEVSTGAAIAFAMEISEFLVLAYTSSLTLSIAGIFKDICQLVLAVELNGDQLSLVNILGLVLCLGGICCHIIHKYSLIAVTKGEENAFAMDKSSRSSEIPTNVTYHKNIGQNVPLLDSNELNNSDSDDSNAPDGQNSSEVIFDVLKRRDASRR